MRVPKNLLSHAVQAAEKLKFGKVIIHVNSPDKFMDVEVRTRKRFKEEEKEENKNLEKDQFRDG